jgi:cell filamentation protein
MILKNKLDIKSEIELAKAEERLSKLKAKELFKSGLLDTFKAGSFESLAEIHRHLFGEIYDFAGKIRTVNISKGSFRFAPVTYLEDAVRNIEKMPQSTFDEIIEKYIEMNIAHPFREGNGRSMRIWLDVMLKCELKKVVDWSMADKNDYLLAMERSPIKETEIKLLLSSALSSDINDVHLYMKGIDASYHYEGYALYKTEELGDGGE